MTTGAPAAPMDDSAQSQTPLQRAVAALAKMKARLDAVEKAANEPIAIIGLGCRFPGGGVNPAAFWSALERGVDGVGEIPPSRWPHDAVPGGSQETRWAGLIDHVDTFDAAFFGIAPREAESLDPQQRLLLEVAWETLEDAGLRPGALEGSRTGVFVGLTGLDYRERVSERGTGAFDAYCATGNMLATAAGRVSYVLGLQGPAMVVETACSSSLVAIHQACASLRAKECELALAGGVNLLLSPTNMALIAATMALSVDGRCRTLDSRANGFVRSEGCGLVALKRLSSAQRDGDRILSVILGSAVNQDGRSTGLTAPNVLAQQALLRQALENARLSPADIGYVEMHGTGTALGDPIEFEALRAVLGQPRADGSTCVLGSVKSNIGHLEAAAGVAGLIKAVQCLRHGKIAGNLHFKRLNPRVSFRDTPFAVVTEMTPWQSPGKPRRAGVSSFGISGTNAHVVLEEAPEPPTRAPVAKASGYLLPLSARSEPALRALARSHADWLAALPGDDGLGDVVYTAAVRRGHHSHRLATAGSTARELADNLVAFLDGGPVAGRSAQGTLSTAGPPKLVMVFSGQGSQWAGMGRQLLGEEPVFRAKVDECDALLAPLLGWSVRAELTAAAESSRLAETEVAQPALFTLQVALAALLESWGVVPDAVIGHSIGEVAAAHVCGALPLAEAARLVSLRGKIMQRATGLGKMAWIALPAKEVAAVIAGRESQVGIGAVNDPASTVLSGEGESLDEVVASLSERGIQCRPLRVNYAFHSPQMTALAAELAGTLGEVERRRTSLPMYSAVTGAAVDGLSLDAEYWRRNVRDPVQFAAAVQSAYEGGGRLFLEVGPHPVLTANLQQCLSGGKDEAHVVFTLRRDGDDHRSILAALGGVYAHGAISDLHGLFSHGGSCVTLPTYPFQRERFWLERAVRRVGGGGDPASHPLLGRSLRPARQPLVNYWEETLDVGRLPYLADHRVRGELVFPGAGYLEMAFAAAAKVYGTDQLFLEECQFERMLVLPATGSRRIQATLQDEEGRHSFFEILSPDEAAGEWVRVASMTVRQAGRHADDQRESPRAVVARCTTVVEREAHYADAERRGLSYGPAFRGVERIWIGTGEAIGHVRLPPAAGDTGAYHAPPALLDACLQVSIALFGSEGTFVPAEVAQIRLHHALPGEVWAHVAVRAGGAADSYLVDIRVTDDEGRPYMDLVAVSLRRAATTSTDPFAGCAFNFTWLPAELPPPAELAAAGTWLLLADRSGTGRKLASCLRGLGAKVVEVEAGNAYARKDADHFTVHPTDQGNFARLLQDALPDGAECQGVIHLWGLDAAPWESITVDNLMADTRLATFSTVRLVQALVEHGFRDAPGLTLITRGATSVAGTVPIAGGCASSLWGLGRVIAVERPEFQCVRIDLDPVLALPVERLAREIVSRGGEDQVAFRGEQRLVARLERRDVEPAEDIAFGADSTYLITGGLGGLGLHVADWMAAHGARNLVLIGRGAPSDEAQAQIARMAEAGVHVAVLSADVAVSEDIRGVVEQIQAAMPPLRGVIHAAGVVSDRTLLDMDEASFWSPLYPKVLGAWNLHEATLGLALDFFVMYSSAASVFGSPGQGNYAAANSFLDALSHHRAARGLPAMSIQWGPYSELGMAASLERQGKKLSLRGVQSFTPDDGTQLLSRLLQAPRVEVALARLSVRQLFDFYPRLVLSPLFELLRDEQIQAPGAAKGHRFIDELMAMRPAERRGGLERKVVEQLARVLGLAPVRLDPHAPLQSLGMDSLMSLEAKDRLEAGLGLRLSPAILYTYPTVVTLVEHLLAEMRLGPAELGELAGGEEDPATQIWDELSNDSAVALLDEKMLDLEDYLK